MFTNALSLKLRGNHAPLRRTTRSNTPSSLTMGAAAELAEFLVSE